jgi:CRP-like cAMP-binding protein
MARPENSAVIENHNGISNKLLLSLSKPALDLIRSQLEYTELPLGLTLRRPGRLYERTYFPNAGVVSLIVNTQDGESAEVGVVGNEGMTNASSAVGLRQSPLTEIVQHVGSAWGIGFSPLQQILDKNPEIQRALSQYAMFQSMHIAQIAGCNRLHSAEARLSRWLLMVSDRTGSNSAAATQDFLSTLLGVARPSVSRVARGLQRIGAIRYARGRIDIANRKKLEAKTCECYQIVSRLDFKEH